MGKIQERMREIMGRLSKTVPEKKPESARSKNQLLSKERLAAEEQKKKALERLKNRTIIRPVKKSIKESKPDGKYIKPKVTVSENSENIEKKQIQNEAEPAVPVDVKPAEKQETAEQKNLAALVKKLRGISGNHAPKKQNTELPEQPEISTGFEDMENFLSADEKPETDSSAGKEKKAFVINKPDDAPDETVATALSVALGIIYWDEADMLVDRIITVRRIFRRQGDILIDAFCHDIAGPRLILFSRVVRLYDLKTLAPYENPKEFLLHWIAGISKGNIREEDYFISVLSVVRYDLAALAFVARADSDKSAAENGLILKYVQERCDDIPFNSAEMLEYISMLYPDEQSFYEAVDVIVKQSHNVLYSFVETFLQLILSDAVIHDNERELLAELLYILRLEGIELNILGLK